MSRTNGTISNQVVPVRPLHDHLELCLTIIFVSFRSLKLCSHRSKSKFPSHILAHDRWQDYFSVYLPQTARIPHSTLAISNSRPCRCVCRLWSSSSLTRDPGYFPAVFSLSPLLCVCADEGFLSSITPQLVYSTLRSGSLPKMSKDADLITIYREKREIWLYPQVRW